MDRYYGLRPLRIRVFGGLNWCRRGPQLIQATSLGLKLHGSIDRAFLRHQLSLFIKRVLVVPLISNYLASIHKFSSGQNSINSLFSFVGPRCLFAETLWVGCSYRRKGLWPKSELPGGYGRRHSRNHEVMAHSVVLIILISL